jgi:predicted metal-dependent phosphoesterase TrpH
MNIYSHLNIIHDNELHTPLLPKYKDMHGKIVIDTHMHSSASYDNAHVTETRPQAIIDRQKELGIVPLLTDHDTLDGIELLIALGENIERRVEIKFKPLKAKYFTDSKNYHTLHINLLGGLNKSKYDNIKNLINIRDMDMFVDFLSSEKIAWQYNHPAWHEFGEHFNRDQMINMAKHYAPVIELNAGKPKYANDLAIMLAKEFGKGISAGSDGHSGTGSVGRAYVIADGADFYEAWENVKAGRGTVIRHDATSKDIVNEAKTMINQIFSDERLKYEGNNSDVIKNIIAGIINFKIPIKSHIAVKTFLLWYASIFGDYTVKKTYINPINNSAIKTLKYLKKKQTLQYI